MLYVIQVLSAILIGVAIGSLLGSRHTLRLGGSAIAIALALITIFTGSWVYLAIGTAIFLFAMGLSGGAATARG